MFDLPVIATNTCAQFDRIAISSSLYCNSSCCNITLKQSLSSFALASGKSRGNGTVFNRSLVFAAINSLLASVNCSADLSTLYSDAIMRLRNSFDSFVSRNISAFECSPKSVADPSSGKPTICATNDSYLPSAGKFFLSIDVSIKSGSCISSCSTIVLRRRRSHLSAMWPP